MVLNNIRFMQTAGDLLMIRPAAFGFNPQTVATNYFQQANTSEKNVQELAAQEFEGLATLLRDHDIDVLVVNDTIAPTKPDAVFPNNWISFHEDGTIFIYPMHAANRRWEKQPHVLGEVLRKFDYARIEDLSYYEQEQRFLEGTGSMVLDRTNQIAYACYSHRTDKDLFITDFAARMSYLPVGFHATDEEGHPVYHTNVMMSIADRYAVICLEAITDEQERALVAATLQQSGKTLIPISRAQMQGFAGNILQVHNRQGKKYLVMSDQAYEHLTAQQKTVLTQFNPILHTPLSTIETYGGGSARCMIAEIFLPLK